MKSMYLLVLSLLSAQVSAQAAVPHTFESGKPARASEVNENFDALEVAIVEGDEAVAARLGPTVLDGNGTEIGLLISIGENHTVFFVVNQLGYIQGIDPGSGSISSVGEVYFESSDCTGIGYVQYTFSGHVQAGPDSLGNPTIYYVDKLGVPASNIVLRSRSSEWESGCFSLDPWPVSGGEGWPFWPVLTNDPAVTGVSSRDYLLPIRIERAP